jgi:hypothetical protein
MSAAEVAMPRRVAQLPKDHVGRPVPWFVAWINGIPDFRIIRPRGIDRALAEKRCWVCGGRSGSRAGHRAFTVGPMCAVNRTSAEPPAHRDCAVYSATACPFLTTPQMTRRERRMPAGTSNPAGTMIRRNPGVALVWISRGWSVFSDGRGGILFDLGEPAEVLWFARGREATRAEVLASIDSGLPLLGRIAQDEGPEAVAELERQHQRALQYVPAEVA